MDKQSKISSLDSFRKAAAVRDKKHSEFEKQMKARHAAGKEDMKGAIDRLAKHLNKEDVAVNNVGQGNIAGVGVGPQGEPPAKTAMLRKIKTALKRKVPNVGTK